VVIALNKSDLGAAGEKAFRDAWDKTVSETESKVVPSWHSISAQTGDGVAGLVQELFSHLPEGPLLFPEDILSDYPRKLNIADVIREKLFANLRDEVPHSVAVWVETLDDAGPEWVVKANIYVDRFSQKGIVIGEKGRMLRKVRRSSEAELQSIYEHPVKLELWVKVEKDWGRNFWLLKKFGYVS